MPAGAPPEDPDTGGPGAGRAGWTEISGNWRVRRRADPILNRQAQRPALQALPRTVLEAARDKKSADWKLAAWLKAGTQASNGWLSQRLHLGAPAALSRNLTLFRRHRQADDPTWKRLTSISAT